MNEFSRTLKGHGLALLPLHRCLFLWNQFDSVLAGLPRSNNIVEGWRNGFQSLVGTSNPTLWTFLTAMKQEENLTFAKRVKMRMNEQPEPKKRKLVTLRAMI